LYKDILRDTNALIFVFLTNNALVSLDAAGQRARRLARMRSSVAAQPRWFFVSSWESLVALEQERVEERALRLLSLPNSIFCRRVRRIRR
jgi:hypothetical protein